jgi:hypothetical protein
LKKQIDTIFFENYTSIVCLRGKEYLPFEKLLWKTKKRRKAKMKKFIILFALFMLASAAIPPPALAVNTAKHGKISGKTVVAGVCSLLLWPGIGQYLNDNETKKNVTHAVFGLFPLFRFWSGWDALIARQGGRWDGKI